MSGLVAVRAHDGSARERARRMLAAAPHRGDQFELLELGQWTLGVQGESAGSAGDAGVFAAQGLAVAFAGVIDDVTEDVAVALHTALRDDGAAVLPRLRGVFTIVYTDGERLWAVRDHVGYRSIFYRRDGGGAYVASEAKQVVAGAGIAKEPDLETVSRIYFRDTRGTLPAALRGVERLGQASVLELDVDAATARRYWRPEDYLESGGRLPAGELQERFDDLMSQAARRAVSGDDVVLLSGGVDSPAVAAYARGPHDELSGSPLKAFSYIYPRSPRADERRYTEAVAEELGLELHLAEPQANPMDDMDEWARLADGPVVLTALSLYAESYRLSRALGARTVLTGELAEFVMAFNDQVIQHLLGHGRVRAAIKHARGMRTLGTGRRALARELAAAMVPAQVSRARARRQMDGVPQWIDASRLAETMAESTGWIGGRWRWHQLAGFTGTSVSMTAEDACQAACGVVVRRPWTDIDLWQFFLGLPADVRFPPGPRKTLARQLLRGRVPDAILDRRDKTVFDDSVLKSLDYETLGRWIAAGDFRLPGVDYTALGERLERRQLSAIEFMWAKDLASVHAFVSLF